MVSSLNANERIFLAGCIKSMMLADGSIEAQELSELDVLRKKLHFEDFDSRLEEFEAGVKDEESFGKMAHSIKRPGARTVILDALRALMLHEGFPERPEEHLLARLEAAWKT